jgi:hypothetical protein
VQYDFGRQLPDEIARKDTIEDNLGRPNKEIRAFLGKLKGLRGRTRLKDNMSVYLKDLCQKKSFERSKYPGAYEDKLYEPTYRHKHHELTTCTICARCDKKEDEVCNVALESSCAELKCNDNNLVTRCRLEKAKQIAASGHVATSDEAAEALGPVVHFGRIASGDLVMKSGYHRDKIAAEEKVIAFEMEGAGVWDNFPTVVIKAICDYADSHKNEKWQGYAAVVAAACMKAFLKEWRSEDKPEVGFGEHLSFLKMRPCNQDHYTP